MASGKKQLQHLHGRGVRLCSEKREHALKRTTAHEKRKEKRAHMGKEGNTIGKEENLTAAPVKKERKKEHAWEKKETPLEKKKI